MLKIIMGCGLRMNIDARLRVYETSHALEKPSPRIDLAFRPNTAVFVTQNAVNQTKDADFVLTSVYAGLHGAMLGQAFVARNSRVNQLGHCVRIACQCIVQYGKRAFQIRVR